jgi:hypothetical protein
VISASMTAFSVARDVAVVEVVVVVVRLGRCPYT